MPDHAGIHFPPPFLFVATFLGGVGLQAVVPLPPLPSALQLLAPPLALAWVVLTIPSFASFWRVNTSVIPIRPTTALVFEGPYRYTRNPMYLGLLLLYVSLACWTRRTWPLLLIPVLIWLVRRLVVDREERYLEAKFGDAYRDYTRRVRRWM